MGLQPRFVSKCTSIQQTGPEAGKWMSGKEMRDAGKAKSNPNLL
jgi:hypothetical protein